MADNASFARTYVRDQLSQQCITFKSADMLTVEDRGSACLVRCAGKPITTGKQADYCANDLIGAHVRTVAGGKI